MRSPEDTRAYTIDIATDAMQAWICFASEAPVALEVLCHDVEAAGVVCGVDTYFLMDLAEAHQPGHRYCIANAVPPEAGIEYFFSRSCERAPKRLPDGRVDFYNLEGGQNVVQQQILAARIPPERCRPGYTVTGQEIPPPRTPEALPEAGPNVAVRRDGEALIALINGHPVMDGKQLRVDPTYTHDGNVDFSIGNLTCIGDLVITGDIKSGFSVKGAQDVTVHGVVDGGDIHAGRDVYLCGNVFGNQKSTIYGAHTVRGTYVDAATIEAGHDIVLMQGARRSILKAARSIILQGVDKSIIGGMAQACDRIVAFDLGSNREIPTHLEILPGVFDAKTALQLLRQLGVLLEADGDWLRELRHTSRTDAGLEALDAVVARCRQALPNFMRYAETRQPFGRQAPKPFGTVIALGTAYPGVRVRIGNSSLQLAQPVSNVMFYQAHETIRMQSLDGTDVAHWRAE